MFVTEEELVVVSVLLERMSFKSLSSLLFISILNKLTPEKFDKLCLELLNVGVDSKLVLKGIILLVRIFFFLFLCNLVLKCTFIYPFSSFSY